MPMSVLKKDHYIAVLDFLIHNTVRNHRPKLPTLVQNWSYNSVTLLGLFHTSHRPKSPSEITIRN